MSQYCLLHKFNTICISLESINNLQKNVEERVGGQNEYIHDLGVKFLLFKDKIMFKSHLIKSNHRVLWINKVFTYGASVLAPDSTTVLAANMSTNVIHIKISMHKSQKTLDALTLAPWAVRQQAVFSICLLCPGNPYWRDRLSTDDLLVLTNLDELLLIMQTLFTFYNSMRRSTELSLPLQLVFPGCAAQ